jgi:hypothetical protein
MSELNYGQFNISQQLAVFVNSLYAKNKCLCFVHKGIAGSRVILQIISENNMVEVECPLCAESVDLGSDTTGTYECPYCTGDFEYKPIQRNFVIDWIFFPPGLVKIKISMLMFFFTIILYGIGLLLGGQPCSGTGCYGGGP